MLCPSTVRVSPRAQHERRRVSVRRATFPCCAVLLLPFFFLPKLLPQLHAQTNATPPPPIQSSPAAIPAGALDALPLPPADAKSTPRIVSPKQAREADAAYLAGAKEIQRKNVLAAEKDFARAAQLNPYNRDYTLALIVARQTRLTELVQQAAKARLLGDPAQADALLEQARAIDPTNPTVLQHFAPAEPAAEEPRPPSLASTLAPPIALDPTPGPKDIHLSGDPQTVIRGVYSAFGIAVSFDTSFTLNTPIQFQFKAISYADATRVLAMLTHSFAVPVQPKLALVAKDTQDVRDRLMPLVEETIYLPGFGQDQMQELANVARTVFDVKQVTASPTGGFMLLRGDERVLDQVNATYADMLDGGSEVLFDVTFYEVDKTHLVNVGASVPGAANLFSVQAEAAKLVAANQSTINTVLASGQIQLTGNAALNTLIEAAYLVEFGGVTDANLTNLLGTIGKISGVPIAGIALSASSTFNLLLNSTDTRILDALQLRASNHQIVSFRVGSRYPIVTSSYSSPLSGTLTAAEAALLKQYTGLSSLPASTAAPQVQFEDLGITLKITPQILHNESVSMAFDMKIESLAGSSVNGNPILNSRALTSTINVPVGQSAMLATLVDTNDIGSFTGVPGLNEIPGFQGTDQDVEKDTNELLITITPHLVRSGAMRITSRRLAAVHNGSGLSSQ
jgi:general secretion pathway protein D